MPMPSVALAALFVLQGSVPIPSESPVSGYWQQHVEYTIAASLDEPSGVLQGTQRLEYHNRSPDTLTTLSFHLYLNAFRPGSRWAGRDSVEGDRRFNDLPDPHFGFNHVWNVRIMGRAVEPVYPFAPDSTIVRFALPEPLPPGGRLTAEMEWDARPSIPPRRQGRRGRAFDFAQWYPRVVVYDRHGWNEHPLYPAGEFYGEFGTYLVDLDVPADQVIGATGVPVCGDPGWEGAQVGPQAPRYQRRFYLRDTNCQGLPPVRPGRKRVVFYAEDVHHVAISMNPEYRYEGGEWNGVAIHVLYQPGDEETWGGGVVVDHTATSLAWLDELFGPYPWPQMTVVHRIEGGGTEFPMMQMNGSASLGLNLHEGGHNYLMGILANNEWREGFLDEGFTSFQTAWYFETHAGAPGYPGGLESFVLGLDLDGRSEPVSLVSEDYRDFLTYAWMIYRRGQLFFHQLRYIVGDQAMRQILRTYYQRWKLKHVDEETFRSVAEAVSGLDLGTFFGQWLHGNVLYDYGIGRVDRRLGPDGRWRTRVEVVRREEGRIPVDVEVTAGGESARGRVPGLARREWIELETSARPNEVRIDPDGQTHDWNMLNNRRVFGIGHLLGQSRPTAHAIDTYFSERTHRDRLAVGWAPTVWYNDAGGITLGVRRRSNYLGRFERHLALVSRSTGWVPGNGDGNGPHAEDLDFFLRYENPTWLRRPNHSQRLEMFRVEGRFGATLSLTRRRQEHATFGPTMQDGITLRWLHVDDVRYLDPGLYDDASTVELEFAHRIADRRGPWQLDLAAQLAGGLAYNRDGLAASGRPDLDPFYGRLILTGTARRHVGNDLTLALRGFAAVSGGEDEAVKQRQVYLAGADPTSQISNPFLRSRGALLVGDDIHYHAPGGANLRGIDPRVSTAALLALNAEMEWNLVQRTAGGGLFNRLAVAGFVDVAHTIGGSAQPLGGDRITALADAGLGLRAYHRIGQTAFVTRLDFPLYVSRPEFAHDRGGGGGGGGGDGRLALRWTISFEPAL